MKTTFYQMGREFTRGLLTELWCWLAFAFVVSWLLAGFTNLDMDDTDLNSWHRSGMTVLTDHRTGIQYLRTGNALTPRLDSTGQVMTSKATPDNSAP